MKWYWSHDFIKWPNIPISKSDFENIRGGSGNPVNFVGGIEDEHCIQCIVERPDNTDMD